MHLCVLFVSSIDPLHSLLTLACLSVEREPMEYAVILFCKGEACEISIDKKVECMSEAFLLFFYFNLIAKKTLRFLQIIMTKKNIWIICCQATRT